MQCDTPSETHAIASNTRLCSWSHAFRQCGHVFCTTVAARASCLLCAWTHAYCLTKLRKLYFKIVCSATRRSETNPARQPSVSRPVKRECVGWGGQIRFCFTCLYRLLLSIVRSYCILVPPAGQDVLDHMAQKDGIVDAALCLGITKGFLS